MGSFANSAHLLHDDHKEVAEAIRELMLEAGFAPADDAPDPDGWSLSGDVLATVVSHASDGWVSLLHSELLGLDTLASVLSDYFETWAVTVSVNDSDWWQAMLFKNGELVGDFDTMAEIELLDELSEELSAEVQALLAEGDTEAADERITEHAEEMRRQVASLIPDDIREMQERLQSDTATEAEFERYAEWARTSLPSLADEMSELLDAFMPGFRGPRRRPEPQSDEELQAEETRLRELVSPLCELLQPEITEDYAMQLLSARAPRAEDDVRTLMQIIGIPPAWADLSYACSGEFSASELHQAGIQFHSHLKFAAQCDDAPPPELRLI